MKNQNSKNPTNVEALEYFHHLDKGDTISKKKRIGHKDNLSLMGDTEITAYFREAAVERGRCGFNAVAGNQILGEKMMPAYKELATRGEDAMRALLQLTRDESPHVRLAAASFAYDFDPAQCRSTLQELLRKLHPVGALALVLLLHKDSEFSAEFERLSEFGDEQLRRELAQRFGGYLED